MCVFCHYIEERKNLIFESDLAIAIYDNFPVSKGHTLIIPKRHVQSFFDLTDLEYNEIQKLLLKAKDNLTDRHSPDSYNIGINDGPEAGQTIPHCHVHLIPRYKGDTPNPRGGVRAVIPEKKDY